MDPVPRSPVSPPAVSPPTVAPPSITWPGPGAPPPDLAALVCPNCGSTAPKLFVLTIDVQLPDNPGRTLRVAGCPSCGARFYDDQTSPDYAKPGLNDRGRVPFYVQQGAGVSLITRPIAQVRRPPGTTYLEVGCGYGFGLDYAINTRGWVGRGIDPAPLAALGRDALHLPVELRYLRDDDEARGTIDVVLGSEVIEHVTSPSGFVRTLRAMLAPGGVLILTTPNGLDIHPGAPPGVLIPLLSPCLHLTIQTPDSLRGLLTQAGFGHIQIEIDSHSLVAFASDAPIALEQDGITLRRALRSHLSARGHALGAGGPIDLVLGFAGRGYMEALNDGALDSGALDEADALWPLLTAACQSQFGIDLDTIDALPDGVSALGLEAMARRVPLTLGGLVYAHSIRRLTAGTPRPALAARFRLAAAAAAAMRHALGGLAMEDGQTEDIGWTALAEAALCDAVGGAATALQDLPGAPQPGRRRTVLQRGFGLLVSAGHHAAARTLLADPDLHDAEADPLSSLDRDTVFFRGMLALQPGATDSAQAADWFARVEAASAPGDGLWWAALRGGAQALGKAGADLLIDTGVAHPGLDWPEDLEFQVTAAMVQRNAPDLVPRLNRLTPARQASVLGTLVNTGRLALARIMLAAGAMAEPTNLSDPAERDRMFFMAVVDAEIVDGRPTGDPLRAIPRFAAVRAASQPGEGLWWAALLGGAQAMGPDSDALLVDTHTAHPGLDWPEDLSFALTQAMVRQDAPNLAPRLARLTPAQQAIVLGPLVNTGRLALARAMVASGVMAAPVDLSEPTERDRMFYMAVIDTEILNGHSAGEPARAIPRFAAVRAASEPGNGLWTGALRGELQSLDLLGRQKEGAQLVRATRAANPGVSLPADILVRIGVSA